MPAAFPRRRDWRWERKLTKEESKKNCNCLQIVKSFCANFACFPLCFFGNVGCTASPGKINHVWRCFTNLPHEIHSTDSFNAAWSPACFCASFAPKLLWFPPDNAMLLLLLAVTLTLTVSTPLSLNLFCSLPHRPTVWLATCVDRTCGICVTFQYPVAWFLFSYFLCWFCNVSGGSRRRERRGCCATLCPRPTTWRVASHKSNAKHCLLCCFEATLFRCFATFRPLSCLLSTA